MNETYKINDIGELIKNNDYVGRGIVIGKSADGKKAAYAYFIMGRSENSRNRVFVKNGEELTIYPFDETKVEDPSLIIYNPIRKLSGKIVVTNGDQTDTVYKYLSEGKTFEDALETRCFEPDSPNFTPRISGLLNLTNGYDYKLSILKSGDSNGTVCNRYTFNYAAINGLGHFIHTYKCNGNPIPTFEGEPERVAIPDSIDEFTHNIWDNLDLNNKIALYVEFVDLESKKAEYRLINKNV